MNPEILKLAKECSLWYLIPQGREDVIEAFYRAAFNAGQASQVQVSIPTRTMEQEFQAHYRRGFNAGLEAAVKSCAEVAADPSSLWEESGCWQHAVENCAYEISKLEMKP